MDCRSYYPISVKIGRVGNKLNEYIVNQGSKASDLMGTAMIALATNEEMWIRRLDSQEEKRAGWDYQLRSNDILIVEKKKSKYSTQFLDEVSDMLTELGDYDDIELEPVIDFILANYNKK